MKGKLTQAGFAQFGLHKTQALGYGEVAAQGQHRATELTQQSRVFGQRAAATRRVVVLARRPGQECLSLRSPLWVGKNNVAVALMLALLQAV